MARRVSLPVGAWSVARRYKVEAPLASGGMGSVYRVRDESSGRLMALKRLLPNASATTALLFRKEYHTLARLRHPSIIEVYDYGVDDDVPFYTMELLDGQDLRALAPLPYAEACRHLRDVASALSLLHAHRLLHRDLTPANVRVTSNGRCKLIDFGALTPFGVPEALVGTPPFVAPEALREMALDQRADLFSLGALAYFLLTKRNAYPSRSFGELESAWARRVAPPSAALADAELDLPAIPRQLDELVMSLLSTDRLARPASAGEVIERLGAVVQLEPDTQAGIAQSYLMSARMAGRAVEIERARGLLERTVDGLGAVVTIEHEAGAGASRLLTEIGLEARIAGATILQLDAEVHRGPYAVAKALAQKLTSALPAQAKELASEDVLALGWLRSERSDRAGASRPPIDPSASPGVWRLRAQSALEKWFLDVAAVQPLAILIDNLQRVDESSAALLALLAAKAPRHPLFVATTIRRGEPVLAAAAVKKLLEDAEHVALRTLTVDDTAAVVRSLFGDVPNVERLARWLHRLSHGYPQHIMALSRYLVTRGWARYSDGVWSLPRELPADVPSRFEDTLDDRISKLTPVALALARALSVHEGPLDLALCAALAEAEQGDPFAALDELSAEGILVGFGNGYHFEQEALRLRILASVGQEEQLRLHRLLGGKLLDTENPDVAALLSAGWHLLYGGDEKRGAEILRRVALDLVAADELPEAVPALEAAVSVYRKLGRPMHQLLGLLEPLAFAGYYVDRRLAAKYGDEVLQLLSHETGLALTVRLRPYLGSYISLVVGLLYAICLHLFGGRGGLRVLNNRVAILGGISCALTGTSTICLDHEGAARRAAVFEPFSVMGKRHGGAFCHALAKALVQLTEDHAAQTIAELRDLLARIDQPFGVIGLPQPLRPIIKGGILFALGALEGFTDPPRAIACADELEACGLRLYDMVACQIRANYHACQGNADLAREYEKEVEMHAVRNGSAWQAEAWAPSGKVIACIATGDLIGLKNAAEELARLVLEIPSFSRIERFARVSLKALRGEYAAAIPLLEQILEEEQPRENIGWGVTVGVLAWAYNETGQHARAAALCSQALTQLAQADRLVVAINLRIEVQLALAEAGLGQIPSALERIDGLLALHGPQAGAVTIGSLHRARAQVALLSGDREALEQSCKQTEHWFRKTNNPVLIAQSERMVRLILRSSAPPAASEDASDTINLSPAPPSLLLAACSGPEARAQRVIDHAAALYRAQGGFLFGVHEGKLALLATNGDQKPAREMAEALTARITNMLEEQRTMTVEAPVQAELLGADTTPAEDALAGYTVIPLALEAPTPDSQRRVLGAIVLSGVGVHASSVSDRFVRRCVELLYESADISTLRVQRVETQR
jgi:Protein kinase domain/AAA ATPase domain